MLKIQLGQLMKIALSKTFQFQDKIVGQIKVLQIDYIRVQLLAQTTNLTNEILAQIE